MEVREILRILRETHRLTQAQLAERVHVTRQAVSRWETGETQPNTDTLQLLSQVFHVSIHTLLGAPQPLFCSCCGMPLTDAAQISREPDGRYQPEYCRWCYADGQFAYPTRAALAEYLAAHMPNPDGIDEATRRTQFDAYLSQLKHWK